MKLIKRVSLVFIAYMTFIVSVYAFGTQVTITSEGNIVTPPHIEADPSTILWGNVTQGRQYTYNVTLTNNGETVTSPLNMTTDGWLGLTLEWDGENKTINPNGGNLLVTFTLSVAQTATIGPFNFNIYING